MSSKKSLPLNANTRPESGISAVMAFVAVLSVPLVFFTVVILWPESMARQLAAVGAAIALAVLFFQRKKYEALLIATVVLSQFYLSLHSIDLNPPVKLQIFFSDVLLIALVLMAIEEGVRFRLDSLGWLFLALLLWSALATLTSAHYHRSLIFLLGQFKFLVLYGLAVNTQINDALVRRLFHGVVIIVVVQSILALAQLVKGSPIGLDIIGEVSQDVSRGYLVKGNVRVSGTITGTNSFAGYITLMLVFLLPFLFVYRKPLLFFGYGLGCIALMLSLSRAGWLSFSIGSLLAVVMMMRAGMLKFTRWLMVSFFCCLVFFVGVVAYHDQIVDRFQSREAIQSATGRLTQVEKAWDVVKNYPLTGIGPGITEFFGRWNDHRKYVKKALPDVNLENQVHNSQLQIAIESGIPALFLFLLITISLVRSACRRIKPSAPIDNMALLRIGGTCAAIAVLIHASFGTELNNPQIFLAFWAILGLSRSERIVRNESSQGSSAVRFAPTPAYD